MHFVHTGARFVYLLSASGYKRHLCRSEDGDDDNGKDGVQTVDGGVQDGEESTA